MDRTSIFGLALGLAAILGGQILEGGALSSLLQATAFAIVIGGTLGAVMLQSTPAVFLEGVRLASWAFTPPRADFRGTIDRVSTPVLQRDPLRRSTRFGSVRQVPALDDVESICLNAQRGARGSGAL